MQQFRRQRPAAMPGNVGAQLAGGDHRIRRSRPTGRRVDPRRHHRQPALGQALFGDALLFGEHAPEQPLGHGAAATVARAHENDQFGGELLEHPLLQHAYAHNLPLIAVGADDRRPLRIPTRAVVEQQVDAVSVKLEHLLGFARSGPTGFAGAHRHQRLTQEVDQRQRHIVIRAPHREAIVAVDQFPTRGRHPRRTLGIALRFAKHRQRTRPSPRHEPRRHPPRFADVGSRRIRPEHLEAIEGIFRRLEFAQPTGRVGMGRRRTDRIRRLGRKRRQRPAPHLVGRSGDGGFEVGRIVHRHTGHGHRWVRLDAENLGGRNIAEGSAGLSNRGRRCQAGPAPRGRDGGSSGSN